MNIDYDDFYRLRVDVTKTHGDQYQFVMERIDLKDTFHSTKNEYYLNLNQFKQLVDFLNKEYDAIK